MRTEPPKPRKLAPLPDYGTVSQLQPAAAVSSDAALPSESLPRPAVDVSQQTSSADLTASGTMSFENIALRDSFDVEDFFDRQGAHVCGERFKSAAFLSDVQSICQKYRSVLGETFMPSSNRTGPSPAGSSSADFAFLPLEDLDVHISAALGAQMPSLSSRMRMASASKDEAIAGPLAPKLRSLLCRRRQDEQQQTERPVVAASRTSGPSPHALPRVPRLSRPAPSLVDDASATALNVATQAIPKAQLALAASQDLEVVSYAVSIQTCHVCDTSVQFDGFQNMSSQTETATRRRRWPDPRSSLRDSEMQTFPEDADDDEDRQEREEDPSLLVQNDRHSVAVGLTVARPSRREDNVAAQERESDDAEAWIPARDKSVVVVDGTMGRESVDSAGSADGLKMDFVADSVYRSLRSQLLLYLLNALLGPALVVQASVTPEAVEQDGASLTEPVSSAVDGASPVPPAVSAPEALGCVEEIVGYIVGTALVAAEMLYSQRQDTSLVVSDLTGLSTEGSVSVASAAVSAAVVQQSAEVQTGGWQDVTPRVLSPAPPAVEELPPTTDAELQAARRAYYSDDEPSWCGSEVLSSGEFDPWRGEYAVGGLARRSMGEMPAKLVLRLLGRSNLPRSFYQGATSEPALDANGRIAEPGEIDVDSSSVISVSDGRSSAEHPLPARDDSASDGELTFQQRDSATDSGNSSSELSDVGGFTGLS